MSTRHALTAVLVLAAVFSCRPDDQRTDTLDPHEGMQAREQLAPEVVAQLDSGSAAFRADDFETALAHYRRVTDLAPDFGAGWFGVYMAEDALGHAEEAQAALDEARGVVPGATLLHSTDADTLR